MKCFCRANLGIFLLFILKIKDMIKIIYDEYYCLNFEKTEIALHPKDIKIRRQYLKSLLKKINKKTLNYIYLITYLIEENKL